MPHISNPKAALARSALLSVLALFASVSTAEDRLIKAEVWVDNWFALYANGSQVMEDSVPITTERSFNAEVETFSAALPITIGIMAKDFKQDNTGLEYIGTRRQQMGDGGLIAQFTNAATGQALAVTNSAMRCLVIHRAPLDTACASESEPVAGTDPCTFEEAAVPTAWMEADFDDSQWPHAVEHSEGDVRPKDGYDEIRWSDAARLIWSDNLVQDNTLLCRMTIEEK